VSLKLGHHLPTLIFEEATLVPTCISKRNVVVCGYELSTHSNKIECRTDYCAAIVDSFFYYAAAAGVPIQDDYDG